MKNDFTVFILTYKRPNKVITYKSLREAGYTGEIILVCSTDDETLEEYKKNYKDIEIFDKKDYRGKFDMGDNFKEEGTVVFARNAVYDIAKRLNKTYFLVLDDDYVLFNFRFDNNYNYVTKKIKKNFDEILDLVVDYYKSIPALSIAFAQTGEYIGGKKGGLGKQLCIKRKIMNSFFSSVDRKFEYMGRMNDDVNTYVRLGNTGKLVFQINQICIQQKLTQKNSGGLTDMYLDLGTYIKSFYTIMFAPSCTKINLMGNKNKRLHHIISWNNACPKIIREKYKLTKTDKNG